MEYLCEFADDTFGFFKVRDIQNATSEPPDGFPVLSRGNKSRQYVVGVDPAKMADRFAICVIEIGTPYKVRYVWTSRKQTYSYSTKKLREILRKFNIVGIAMDQDGGGVAVEEIINKSDVMSGDDRKIYRYDDDSSEAKNGLKMLYMFKFNTNWIDEANTLLQKNIEDKIIMFPMSFKQGDFSSEDDDAIFEINEMKKELAAIEVTHTKSGRRHFDLAPPKIKGENIVVHHKDRYSALLLANFLSSRFAKINVDPQADIKRTFYDNSTCGGWLEDFLRV
jgi:hypothetical protein